ncbi:hypothetical protein [Apibacter sp. HY039]|uniref:hypothetical protein n=1 Tax=Apibacter sp. HY039 TaxID=2501476 RepID=UPI000FEBA689|nr:hypothetical protein [Apibacter sp. HY039]
MNKLLFLSVLLFTLTSCASNFTESFTSGNVKKISSQNSHQYSGGYKIFASREYDSNGSSTILTGNSNKHGIYKFLQSDIPTIKNIKDIERYVRGLKKDSLTSNWNDNDWVNVLFEGNTVFFELKKGNQTVKTFNATGKYKNGFFVFPREKNCIDLSKISNGCLISNKRIGITHDGQLLVQETKKYEVPALKSSTVVDFLKNGTESVYSYQNK